MLTLADFNEMQRKLDLRIIEHDLQKEKRLKGIEDKLEEMEALIDLHSAELKDCNEREQRVKAMEKKIEVLGKKAVGQYDINKQASGLFKGLKELTDINWRDIKRLEGKDPDEVERVGKEIIKQLKGLE